MNEPIAHSGVWALALIMIVVASWVVYRYLAPKSWREWAGAGLVQAFIIALYAEMCGFPLTIYLQLVEGARMSGGGEPSQAVSRDARSDERRRVP